MIINTQISNYLQDYVGKTVFFVQYDQIFKGKITEVDNEGFTVSDNMRLTHGKDEFFHKLEHLLDDLSSHIEEAGTFKYPID